MDEELPDVVREHVTRQARKAAAESWRRTTDRTARTEAARKAAAETYARRRAQK